MALSGLIRVMEKAARKAGQRLRRDFGEVEHLQANHEGDLVDAIHGARGRAAAIVINPGAFTHYAWAIHDALAAFVAHAEGEGRS